MEVLSFEVGTNGTQMGLIVMINAEDYGLGLGEVLKDQKSFSYRDPLPS